MSRDQLRDGLRALEDEWERSTNPILHVAAGRLRQVRGDHPEPRTRPADADPGLDWLVNWAMSTDSDAEQHYWHLNDEQAAGCGCRFEGEGR